MVSVTAVAIVSLVCSLAQLVYMGGLMWLMRQRAAQLRRRSEEAGAGGLPLPPPTPADGRKQQQQKGKAKGNNKKNGQQPLLGDGGADDAVPAVQPGSDTHPPSYYKNFLPTSYLSVPPPTAPALHDAATADTIPETVVETAPSPATAGGISSLQSSAESSTLGSLAVGPTADSAEAAASRAALRARVATPAVVQQTAALYDEDDPFQTRAAARAGEAAALQAAREAALAHGVLVPADGSSFSRSRSPRALFAQDFATPEEDEDGEVLIPASAAASSQGYLSMDSCGNLSVGSSGRRFAPPMQKHGAHLTQVVVHNDAMTRQQQHQQHVHPSPDQVSLDSDDLTQPTQVVDLVLDEQDDEEEGGGGQGHASLEPSSFFGLMTRSRPTSTASATSSRRGSGVVGGGGSGSGSPSIRLQPSSPSASSSFRSGENPLVLHVSAAPFSLPQSHNSNNHGFLRAALATDNNVQGDSYSLMVDDAPHSASPSSSLNNARRSDPPQQAIYHSHSQARMITHPRSLTRGDSLLPLSRSASAFSSSTSASAAGSSASSPAATSAPSAASEAAGAAVDDHHLSPNERRRASLNRKTHANAALALAIPPPRFAQSQHPRLALDPNASPVRRKVLFADSPRDRAKWVEQQEFKEKKKRFQEPPPPGQQRRARSPPPRLPSPSKSQQYPPPQAKKTQIVGFGRFKAVNVDPRPAAGAAAAAPVAAPVVASVPSVPKKSNLKHAAGLSPSRLLLLPDASASSNGLASSSSSLLSTSSSSSVPEASTASAWLSWSSSSSSSASSWPSLLVLPVYKRFLIMQSVHCTLWTVACICLLAFQLNLVGWRQHDHHGGNTPKPTDYDDDEDDDGLTEGDQPSSWLFASMMAVLLGLHAAVFDGLLVFLAARHVGRSTIRFSLAFSLLWGLFNAAVIVALSHAGGPKEPPTAEQQHHTVMGLLTPTNPFFIRSAIMLALNALVLLGPAGCLCHLRARRSNLGRKTSAERVLALQRQQQRRIQAAESEPGDESIAEDSFEPPERAGDIYDDGTQPRNTYVRVALWNVCFRSLLVIFYALDFGHNDPRGPNVEVVWEGAVLALLAVGFLADTPVLYAALTRDSAHWQSEWAGVLHRMRAEAAEAELARARLRRDHIESMRLRGLHAEADAMEAEEANEMAAATASIQRYSKFYADTDSFFIPYSLLHFGALLGSGGFSSVYAAKLGGRKSNKLLLGKDKDAAAQGGVTTNSISSIRGGLDVAVKALHVRDLSTEVVEQFLHEVGMMVQLRHPNVVPFLGVVFSPPDMLLVMAQCRRQSLLTLIKQRKVHFTEFQAVSIALAIADGLRYIHERDILHRDLKAANILFDEHGKAQICDFGLSESRSKIDLSRVFCGTLAYMSPEVLRSECVGKFSDVYSFAIIFWELLHNELAWKRSGPAHQGFHARVLVEMVAYRRARPPLKERQVPPLIVPGANGQATQPTAAAAAGDAAVATAATTGRRRPPLATNAARIDLQAFAGAANPSAAPTVEESAVPAGGSAAAAIAADGPTPAPVPSSRPSRPGIHPMLVQLLREMWRDDYMRRPSFEQIVKRLTAFREMIREQNRLRAQLQQQQQQQSSAAR